VARWAVGTWAAALLKAVWWDGDVRLASLLTHLFLFLFFTALQNTTPLEYSSLFIMINLYYLKHSNCLEYGQISTPAPCVHRNATGFQVRVGVRVSARFGCQYQNLRRERVRIPEPYT